MYFSLPSNCAVAVKLESFSCSGQPCPCSCRCPQHAQNVILAKTVSSENNSPLQQSSYFYECVWSKYEAKAAEPDCRHGAIQNVWLHKRGGTSTNSKIITSVPCPKTLGLDFCTVLNRHDRNLSGVRNIDEGFWCV